MKNYVADGLLECIFFAKKYGFEKAAAVLGWSSQGANREKASI